MAEQSLDYEKELERRASIMTGEGSGDSPIKGLNGVDYFLIILLVALSFFIFYLGWQ